MKAYKCDRCGAYYDTNDYIWVPSLVKNIHLCYEWDMSEKITMIHLCPECLEKFANWFTDPNKVFYICDRAKCEDCTPDNACAYTTDPLFAKNFIHSIDGGYDIYTEKSDEEKRSES